MKKPVLSLLLLICFLGKSFAQKPLDVKNRISDLRDEIYYKLQKKQITLNQAKKSYQTFQKELFEKKDFANYIEIFIFEAVDFYVINDDYSNASKAISEGINALKYVANENHDTLFFKLNSEIAEYYRRIPDKIALSEKHFNEGYDFLQKHQWLETKMPAFVITFLSNYGRLTDDLGDAEQSFNYYQKALRIANENHVQLNKYALLSNLAKYYREKKDFQNTLKLLNEALPTTESDDKTAIVYLSIGRCYNQMKQYEKALNALNEAQKFHKKSKEAQPRLLINIQNNQADAYLGLNQLEKAEKVFQKSLSDFSRNFSDQNSLQTAQIYNGLSEVYEQKSKTSTDAYQTLMVAYQYCNKALHASNPGHFEKKDDFSNVIAPHEYFKALIQRAELKIAFAAAPSASDSYYLAIRYASHLRKSFDLPESKLFYSEKVYPVYEQALSLIYEVWKREKSKDWAEKFFYVLETSKSATLSDALKEQKIRPKTLNDSVLNEEIKIRQRIVKLQIKLLETGDEKISADLSSAKIQLNHLIKNIETQSKSYYTLKYDDRLITLQETQQKLTENTLFMSYFLGENALFGLATDKKNFQLIRLEKASFAKEKVLKLYAKINTPPGIDAYKGHDLAQNCYDILLKPFENLVNQNKKLVIARHDILGFLPFEVLEKTGKSDYLVFEKTISYANSASLQFDFDFTSKPNEDIIAYAPFSNGEKVGRFRDKGFKSLPASVSEIGTIDGKIYQDNEATKLNFNESYRNKGIIHFATHAQIDDNQPEKSFIALYPEGNDFKLYTPELYNLSLEKTQLVVLSACETGKGKIRNGEGIMSLARAFQFAGCPSVITTIWNAHDESMAKLSKNFYKYLENNKPTDEALQLSKIDLIRSTEHPFYWANFVLIGKSSEISISGNKNIYWIVLVAILLNFVAFYFRKKIKMSLK